MVEIEINHKNLLVNVSRLLLFGTSFDGGIDDKTRSLGKWLQDTETTNPVIVAVT